MTRKDYIRIAGAIATVERELATTAEGRLTYHEVLCEIVRALELELAGDNPRFDKARFELAALPHWHEARARRLRESFGLPEPAGESR